MKRFTGNCEPKEKTIFETSIWKRSPFTRERNLFRRASHPEYEKITDAKRLRVCWINLSAFQRRWMVTVNIDCEHWLWTSTVKIEYQHRRIATLIVLNASVEFKKLNSNVECLMSGDKRWIKARLPNESGNLSRFSNDALVWMPSGVHRLPDSLPKSMTGAQNGEGSLRVKRVNKFQRSISCKRQLRN